MLSCETLIVVGTGHRDRGAAEIRTVGASLKHHVNIGLCRSREDGHAPSSLIGDDTDDLLALLKAQPDELTSATIRVDSVDPFVDQPADVAAQFALVDAAIFVEGNDVGSEDTLDLHGSVSWSV